MFTFILFAIIVTTDAALPYPTCRMASNNPDRLKLMNQLLNVTQYVLSQHNISSWISQGTLLGSVRENRTLPWTGDVDLHAFATDIQQMWNSSSPLRKSFHEHDIFVHDLRKNFLRMCFYNHSKTLVVFNDTRFAPESKLELYGCVKRDNGTYKIPNNICENWDFSGLFPLQDYYVGSGVWAKGPSKPVYWMEQYYGKNWKKPVYYAGNKDIDNICAGNYTGL